MGMGEVMANINGPGAGTARNVAWDRNSSGEGNGWGGGIQNKLKGGTACGAGSIFANGTGVGFGNSHGAGNGVVFGSERER